MAWSDLAAGVSLGSDTDELWALDASCSSSSQDKGSVLMPLAAGYRRVKRRKERRRREVTQFSQQ